MATTEAYPGPQHDMQRNRKELVKVELHRDTSELCWTDAHAACNRFVNLLSLLP